VTWRSISTIREGIVDIPQFNIYFTFTGHYLFHDEALASLQTWFAQASDDPLFFSVQRGISISANAFEQVYGEPQTLPHFWKRAADGR
jgi:hypothetical protein